MQEWRVDDLYGRFTRAANYAALDKERFVA